MNIRLTGSVLGAALLAAGFAVSFSVPAAAQSVMKQCSDKYQGAKAANTLKGETWSQFYSQCAKDMKAPAAAPAATTPAAAPVAPVLPKVAAPAPVVPTAPAMPKVAAPMAPAAAAPATGGAMAEQSRIKECGATWKANKATLKPQYGSWPKYWSACNTQMKAQGK